MNLLSLPKWSGMIIVNLLWWCLNHELNIFGVYDYNKIWTKCEDYIEAEKPNNFILDLFDWQVLKSPHTYSSIIFLLILMWEHIILLITSRCYIKLVIILSLILLYFHCLNFPTQIKIVLIAQLLRIIFFSSYRYEVAVKKSTKI
jgi:hypothetical protein